MKIYDRVKKILEKYPDCRNDDKKLMWAVWWEKGLVQYDSKTPIAISRIMYMDFLNAPMPESITRARRKVQELHPELCPTRDFVKRARKQKEATKGNFVFQASHIN